MTDFKAALIRGARAALFGFVGSFAPALLGWLNDVYGWANAHGDFTAFPRPTTLAYAAVAALTGAVTGLIGFLVNYAENRWGFRLLGAKTTTKS